jgi:Calpain family cysteine protease
MSASGSLSASWINSLADSGIKADLLNYASDGVLTDAAAIQILTDVANRGSVTAAELSSLQTIAANLNNGLSTSDYVAYVFSQLVDGNPANSTWTGGNTTSVALGNLQVGTTTTQMSELIGKWFLGTDLPDPSLPAGSDWSLQGYSPVAGPLYSSTGAASINDVCQGGDGDCEFLAGLIDVVVNHPQLLSSMIVNNGNGTYGVRFSVNGQEVWETVNDELPTYGGGNLDYAHNYNEQDTAMWAALVEKAYAQLSSSGLIGHPAINSYNNISADPPTDVFENLTNSTNVTYYLSNQAGWSSEKSTFIAALDSDDDIILEIPADSPDTYDGAGNIQLISDHAFAVLGYDSATGDFIVRNPWGNSYPGQNWDVQFEVSLATIANEDGDFVIDNSGTIDGMPVVVASNVTATLGQSSIAATSLFSVTAANSGAITEYDFWDTGGNGHWVVNGVAESSGVDIYVLASSLSQVSYVFGSYGSNADTLYVRVNDGTLWSVWTSFTAQAFTPTPPSLAVSGDASASSGQTLALSSLVTISDPDSVGYQTLQLWDSDGTTTGGEFLINGVAQTGNQAINVPSGANVVFDAGTGSGTDTLWARLIQSNGTATGWEEFSVSVPAPTVNVSGIANATTGEAINLASLVTVSDSSNATYQLQLWDSDGTTTGGEFLINGVAQTGNHAINVPSGANVVFDAGTSAGTDTLWAQIIQSNGTASGWEEFSVTVPNPTVTVHNDPSATPSQVIPLSTLVTIADPGNVGYQALELWDSNGTPATGQFVVNGVPQTGNHTITVSPANVANTVFDEGSSGSSDKLWAQLVLNNGTLTGWQQFTVTDPVTVAQGAAVELSAPYAGHAIFAGTAGTLQLDSSTGFTGTVAGMTGQDTLDLRDIGFGATTTVGFAENGSGTGGTLSVSDGRHTANIALLGHYMASTFVASSDGHGGTSIVDPPVNQASVLSTPQHA